MFSIGILTTIVSALTIAGISVLVFNKLGLYSRKKFSRSTILDQEETENLNKGETRWRLLAFSLIPGFFLGAVMAGFYEGLGLIEEAEAFSPSFYAFVSLGTIVSYLGLNRLFKPKS